MALRLLPYAHSVSQHLVGMTEVAAMLGVTRTRVRQLRKQYADFPDPEVELAAGPVWSTRAIEAWLRAHPDRRPGRPKTD